MQIKWTSLISIVVVIIISFYLYNRFRIAPDLKLKELELSTMAKEDVDITQYLGKSTLICFAASWCRPCREELEMISELVGNEMSKIQVIVIDDEPLEKVRAFKEQTQYPFLWLKLNTTFSGIDIHSIPTSYLVNSKGIIVKKTVGYIDWKDPSTLKGLLKLME